MRPPRRAVATLASVATGLALAPVLPASAQTTTVATSAALTGTVDVVVVDDHHGGHDAVHAMDHTAESSPNLVTTTMVSTGGRTLTVPAELATGLRPGQRVAVTVRSTARGVLSLGGSLGRQGAATEQVTAVRPLGPGTVTAQSTVRPAAGRHTLTVLPVYWGARDDQTVASLTELATRTARYWAAQSDGAVAVTDVVKDWQRIADPGSCDAGALFDRALAAHHQAVPTAATDHVLVYFPARADCGGWAGLGSVSGSRIWVNGYALLDVAAHEFGHNLGLGHANRATCTFGAQRVALSGACTVEAYQDSADVMGYATWSDSGSLNTALADRLGLARTVTADLTSPAVVDLAPLTDASAVRAVKVDVGTGWVYLDFRPALAPDLRRPEWARVQVHYLPNDTYPQSQLLDLQPWQAGAFDSTSMPAYSVWRVPGSPLAVAVGQVGSTARIRVYATAADTVAPSAPVATATRTGPTSIDLAWTASTDAGSGLAGYRIWVDGVPSGNAAPSATQMSLIVPSTAASLQVEAVDAAGNTAGSSPVAVSPVAVSPVAESPVAESPVADVQGMADSGDDLTSPPPLTGGRGTTNGPTAGQNGAPGTFGPGVGHIGHIAST